MMKIQGEIQLTDDIKLDSPEVRIKRFTYDWDSDDIIVELVFTASDGLLHCYNAVCNSGGKLMTVAQVIDLIKADSIVKLTPIPNQEY